MVSARCGAPTCDGLTSCRRWKSLLVAVILFVDFVVGERPACFVLAWIASSCGWVSFLSQRLGRVRQFDLKLDRR